MAEDDKVVEDEFAKAFGDKKKKKKSKKVDEGVEEEAPAEVKADDGAAADGGDGGEDEFAKAFGDKKKKKKTKKVGFDENEDDTPLESQVLDAETRDDVVFAEPAAITEASGDMPWLGSDREYKYEELLGRVFGILMEHHPELSGEKRRHVMRPPQVAREGTKKTVFINFLEICRTMHRQQDHVYQFLLAELGTSGSIDGNNRLILKGRFLPKGIENVLRRYIGEYVTCHSCKSPDTKLDKENRLYFLRCKSCGASRSVAPIKTGFQAQVGKRSKTKVQA